MVSLSTAVLYHARSTPDQLAIVYRDQRISYEVLAGRVCLCAGMLRESGIGPGDVVALLMKNSSAFLELGLAVSHLGAVLLPINYRLATEEVKYILDHAQAKFLFVDDEFAATVQNFPAKRIVDQVAQSDTRHLAGPAAPVPAAHACKPDALYRLMFTSGTTDRPKGVMHTYGNCYWKSFDHIIHLSLSRDDRLLVVGPLYHVGAYDLPGMAVLLVGGALFVLRDFEPEAVLAAIQRERLTCGWMAPVMLNRVLAYAGRSRFDVSSFKWLIGGGERTPEERIREFTALFHAGRYIDGYGLTETCSGDTLMEAGMEIAKIGSTGRPMPHVAIEIRDHDGRCLSHGEQGEICVRGPKVTPGYWREPDKTKASFFADGWFRTGDIGYLDAEGFLFLTDRMKDMIISGGENIASSEVERALYQLPQVSEAAAIGLPDERWGERVVAVVVLNPGATLSETEVVAHCRSILAGFKVPKQLIIKESLPRNPSGKVLKRLLRSEFIVPGHQ
ncbi:MAG: AMP-binding enzyme family protein 22 [Polaromonas sp.]|nr:AMP-binding enzyme family protein 22 [Polaromonas sp.]